MNARASTSNPLPDLIKPFFTPSDSSRSQSFASSPVRTFRDGVPPTKRRRLASTPTSSSLAPSTPRSSSSRPEQPTLSDLHDARAASSVRVLNIWSALAERYNRRLDEDDIVNIRTGEVIKDRGVLNELPKRYNFGDLADNDDDPAINTDPGSEGVDNLAGDEDEDDEDEDDAEEPDAFPSSDGLVAPQISRLAPLRPATSSSDADDLREFLKAEAIRRELDGGDDSSEDEFTILPPRSTPAKRKLTPAGKNPFAARTKSRQPKTPVLDTESEDEFAVLNLDRNGVHSGYRARRAPSPETPASIPSPPLSSSPGPPSSFSHPSSPLLSHTPRDSNGDPQIDERFGSPTPKRQPLASTSRRTLEESLDEIDLEFPPPQPRAPSIFGRRPSSAFIIDLSLSDDEAGDECPVKAIISPKPLASKSKTVKKTGSTLVSKRPIPFVLTETRRSTRATSTAVVSKSASAPMDPDPVTPPKKGKPRAKSPKDKPPPRIRSALKRKRRISSGPNSGEEQGSPKDDSGQQTSPLDCSRIQTRTIRTPEVIDVDGDDPGDDPEAGESKPQTRSQSRSKTKTEVASTPAPANTTSVVTSPSVERREDDTPNHLDGSYTHFPVPSPLPMGIPSQPHQSFAPYSGHPPPFQDNAINFNHPPYLNHDHNQYGHGPYPLFHDPNTQALLTQAVTGLAILMNGGRPPPQTGHMGGMAGNMPAMNGFPNTPGWGMFPAWSSSTPTTSRYPYGHDHQQRSFQSPYVAHNQMGGEVGPSMPPSTQFPQSNTLPSSLSVPESLPIIQETGAVQERATGRVRSRSKSKRKVTFVCSQSRSAGGMNGPTEAPKRRTRSSPPTTRGRSRARRVDEEAPRSQSNGKGKSKADEADQGPGSDVGDSGNEGSVDHNLSPKSRSGRVRGRTVGPGRR